MPFILSSAPALEGAHIEGANGGLCFDTLLRSYSARTEL
jgi:hypothetical protein